MLEEIIELRDSIKNICMRYIVMNKSSIISEAKSILLAVQNFAVWFIGAEDIGVEKDTKLQMNAAVLSMLEDINISLKNGDSVLMLDALYFGIYEYLKLFAPEEEDQDE